MLHSILLTPSQKKKNIKVFGSWSHTANYINYTVMNETPSILNYTENNEWTLVSYKPSRSEIYYSNWIEKDYFSEIKYTLIMRRKSLFVLQNYVKLGKFVLGKLRQFIKLFRAFWLI